MQRPSRAVDKNYRWTITCVVRRIVIDADWLAGADECRHEIERGCHSVLDAAHLPPVYQSRSINPHRYIDTWL